MLVGVLKTDGGPHPPDVWAQVTASQIIGIASSAPAILLNEAREFEAKLVVMLAEYHADAQNAERDGLKEDGTKRLETDIDTSDHCDAALAGIIALSRGTSFASHFAKPEVRKYLKQLLHDHFHHSMLIERSWHADSDPDHPHSVAFKKNLTDGKLGAWAGEAPPGPAEDKDMVSVSMIGNETKTVGNI